MWRFLNYLFVFLGAVFLLLILAGTYFFVADPYNIKPFIFDTVVEVVPNSNAVKQSEVVENIAPNQASTQTSKTSEIESTSTKINLSSNQSELLESLGIDANQVPKNFTEEQIICFEKILGVSRVGEIKAGSAPTVVELFKAKECL